jgi:hypothetical protein
MRTINLPEKNTKETKGDRRQYAYDMHIPERRNGEDRRDRPDRRRSHRLPK